MMATHSDPGLPPRKRVTTTYGKASRNRLHISPFSNSAADAFSRSSAASEIAPSPGSRSRIGTPIREVGLEKKLKKYGTSDREDASQKPSTSDCASDDTGRETDNSIGKKRKLVKPSDVTPEKDTVQSSSPEPMSVPLGSPKGSAASRSPKISVDDTPDSSAHSTPRKDIEMGNSTPDRGSYSTKTLKALHTLSVRDTQVKSAKHQTSLRLVAPTSPEPQTTPRTGKSKLPTASARVQKPQVKIPVRKKRRLIDTLAAQAEAQRDDDEEQHSSQDTAFAALVGSPRTVNTSNPQPAVPRPPEARTFARPATGAKKTGPKFTYGQQRTMLAEEESQASMSGLDDVGGSQGIAPFLGLGGTSQGSALTSLSLVDEDLEDETFDKGAVQSIHELRQFGANNRLNEEMTDILERICLPSDKPSSLRRGALLELAQRMSDKSFRHLFRNRIDEDGLIGRLGKETDIIAGYSILSVLVTLFATSKSPHLIDLLEAAGVSVVLSHTLAVATDIVMVARDRKSNVSRNGQQTLSLIKSAVLQLPVWQPTAPSTLPPRTLALKCIELMLQQSTSRSGDDRLFTPALTDCIFSILESASEPECFDFPASAESLDVYLALCVLESHSINALQPRLGPRWTSQHLGVIGNLLEATLKRPAHQVGEIESLVFRLMLNSTNNAEAAALFVNRGFLRDLVEAVSGTFDVVSKSITDDSFLDRTLEVLVVMIGLMINFCEHYNPSIERFQDLGDADGSPLDKLFRVFVDHCSRTADAELVEEGKVNVAFGYLSVLLGYLCLSNPLRARFSSFHSGKSLEPLLEAIREFIAIRRYTQQPPPGSNGVATSSESNATDRRLQALVVQLETASR